jgi:hypothetical protein
MKMKLVLSGLLAAFTLAGTGFAGPLVKENVDQDAKWLLHMDLDQFRDSALGQYVIKEIIVLVKQAEAAKANNLLTNIDVAKIIGQLHSVTAYGRKFEGGPNFDGVLLLQVEPETRKILDGLAAGMLLKGDRTLTQTNEGGHILYSLKDSLFVSPQEKGLILFSKSKASIRQAVELMAGRGKHLAGSKTFAEFPPAGDGFILLAVAEGFQDHLPIPPQAQLLRQADGARVLLGERAGAVVLNLALKAKDAEVLTQIQKVVEGMVALGSLGQSENKELQQVLQSIQVTPGEKVLSVSAAYPVDLLITQAGQLLAEQEKRRHQPPKPAAGKPEKPEASAGDSK